MAFERRAPEHSMLAFKHPLRLNRCGAEGAGTLHDGRLAGLDAHTVLHVGAHIIEQCVLPPDVHDAHLTPLFHAQDGVSDRSRSPHRLCYAQDRPARCVPRIVH